MRYLPNVLSALRIVMSVGICTAGAAQEWKWAWWLFVAAALSDVVDGSLARRLGAETKLGHALDRIGDLTLIVSSLLGLMLGGVVPWLMGVPWLVVMAFGILFGLAQRRQYGPPSGATNRKLNAMGAVSFSIILFSLGTTLAVSAYGWHWWYLAVMGGTAAVLALTKGRQL